MFGSEIKSTGAAAEYKYNDVEYGPTPVKEENPIEKIINILINYPAHEQNRILYEVRANVIKSRLQTIERLCEERESIESQINSMEEVTKELKQQ